MNEKIKPCPIPRCDGHPVETNDSEEHAVHCSNHACHFRFGWALDYDAWQSLPRADSTVQDVMDELNGLAATAEAHDCVKRNLRDLASRLSTAAVGETPGEVWVQCRLESSPSGGDPARYHLSDPDGNRVCVRVGVMAAEPGENDQLPRDYRWRCFPVPGTPKPKGEGECEKCEKWKAMYETGVAFHKLVVVERDHARFVRNDAIQRAEKAERERDEARSHQHRRHLQARAETAEAEATRLSTVLGICREGRELDAAESARLAERVAELEDTIKQQHAEMSEWERKAEKTGDELRISIDGRDERIHELRVRVAELEEGPRHADVERFYEDAPTPPATETDDLPKCPKCGKAFAQSDLDGCECYDVSISDWLRYVAESTPCRECGGMPGLATNGVTLFHDCPKGTTVTGIKPKMWIARNKPQETEETCSDCTHWIGGAVRGRCGAGSHESSPSDPASDCEDFVRNTMCPDCGTAAGHHRAGCIARNTKDTPAHDKRREADPWCDLQHCLDRALITGNHQDHVGWLVQAIRLVNAALDGKEQA